MIVENTTIHNFTLVQGPQTDNVLYLVQMPPERVNHLHVQAMPTPPGSDCSSDVDTVQVTTNHYKTTQKIIITFQGAQPLSIDESTDVIVLPLSPEADSLPGPSSGSPSPGSSHRAVEMITYKQSSTVWRPLDEVPKRRHSAETSGKNGLLMDLPDRRRRKRTAKKVTGTGKKTVSHDCS